MFPIVSMFQISLHLQNELCMVTQMFNFPNQHSKAYFGTFYGRTDVKWAEGLGQVNLACKQPILTIKTKKWVQKTWIVLNLAFLASYGRSCQMQTFKHTFNRESLSNATPKS